MLGPENEGILTALVFLAAAISFAAVVVYLVFG